MHLLDVAANDRIIYLVKAAKILLYVPEPLCALSIFC